LSTEREVKPGLGGGRQIVALWAKYWAQITEKIAAHEAKLMLIILQRCPELKGPGGDCYERQRARGAAEAMGSH
jgi:hypothetical protein